MQKLTIITSYFPPEIGAASNRIYHLADGLKNDYDISIITPLPNYPTGKIFEGFKGKFKIQTRENNIEINRLWIFASVSKNKFLRLIAMISYSLSLIWFFIWNKIPNKIIVQSPPLLVAFTCVLFLRSKKRTLILNVSDLWPSAGLELGALNNNFSYKILKRLERFNYNNSNIILGQSNEILTHIKTITKKPNLFLYRNYPDIEAPKLINKQNKSDKNIKIVYAGLLGVAQGISRLCSKLDYENIELHIYGSGAEENQIQDFIKTNNKLPVFFHGRVQRNVLHQKLLHYDIALIPLLNRIYGSVPSKIFEFAKLGLPIIYFGGGEGEAIIEQNSLGWIAKEGDYVDLNKTIQHIKADVLNFDLRTSIQETAISEFNFKTQLDALKKIL